MKQALAFTMYGHLYGRGGRIVSVEEVEMLHGMYMYFACTITVYTSVIYNIILSLQVLWQ